MPLFFFLEVKVWNHLIWNPWKRITLVSKIAWPVILVSNSVVFVSFISKNQHLFANAYCGNPSQSIVAKQQHWVCGSPVTPDWTAKVEAVGTGQGPKLLLKSTCAQSLDVYVRRVHGKWQLRRGHSRTGGNTTHDWTLELEDASSGYCNEGKSYWSCLRLTTTPWKMVEFSHICLILLGLQASREPFGLLGLRCGSCKMSMPGLQKLQQQLRKLGG